MSWRWGLTIDALMPAISALSDFYLDTEFDDDYVQRIATTCLDTGLNFAQISELLTKHVAPATAGNMFSIAGEWAGFDEDWLKERVLRGPRLSGLFASSLLSGYTQKCLQRLEPHLRSAS